MSKTSPDPIIACFGEILWDCLPRGLFLGGAPLNVAYHLSRLGIAPLMISAIGRDFLGDEACRRMVGWGLDASGVARRQRATGTVHAQLDNTGAARYTFAHRPAWNSIPASGALLHRTPPAAVVFGTMALHGRGNRQSLSRLLSAWPQALRVADLNLRPPFDRVEAITWALTHATLLKLNTEELARLVGAGEETPDGWARSANLLALRYRIKRLCVTAGARGAGLLWDGEWIWAEARPVKVRDTIGAGDAFLAALLAGLLRLDDPKTALARACRLGEFTAARDGATPPYQCNARGQPRDQPGSTTSARPGRAKT